MEVVRTERVSTYQCQVRVSTEHEHDQRYATKSLGKNDFMIPGRCLGKHELEDINQAKEECERLAHELVKGPIGWAVVIEESAQAKRRNDENSDP